MDRFENFMDTVLKERKETILLGDFNKDLLRVDTNREWLIFTESLGLTQLVIEPTRVTDNSKTLLDHIYTNEEEHTSNIRVSRIHISDHYAIFCNRKSTRPSEKSHIKK